MRSMIRAISLMGILPLLMGCAKYHGVLFAEHTHFGAQIKLSPTDDKPVDVNMGYDRGIFTVVPRTTQGAEASSVLSKTDLKVSFKEQGEVNNVFAAGDAARVITGAPPKEEADKTLAPGAAPTGAAKRMKALFEAPKDAK